MSLVGPRPALAYEFRKYEVWHRRRVLETKTGITGLWQVEGRSRTPHIQIQPYHFIKAGPAASFTCHKTCNAGFGFQNAPTMPDFVLSEFVSECRARANQ